MKLLFSSLTSFLSKQKRVVSFALVCLIACTLLAVPFAVYADDPISAALRWVGGVTLGTVTSPLAILMWVVFKISSLILGVAGILFNWAMLVLVFEFGKYLGNSPGMTLAWGILRDFGNIGLLFGFIFMGVATILDLHSYPWKKALPRLIIAAVLINFSLFGAEAIVDTTNVLAATLYQQSYGQQNCTSADWLQCVVNTGFAGIILEKIQITTAFSSSTFSELTTNIVNQLSTPIENIMKFVLLSIVTSVAAVVLFAGAFMMISRGVILAFLLVTSPIGIAGMAIEPLKKLAEDWWKKLIDQALFAPVFILLLLVSLKMTDGLAQLTGPGGLAAALNFADVGNTTGTLLFFALIIGFMIGSLMLASKFGIYGADFAIKSAGGAVYGTMGLMGRRFIGRPAMNYANRLKASGRASNTLSGKLLAGVAGYAGGSSFSARGLVGGAIKSAGKVDIGKVGDLAKKGAQGAFDKKAEDEAKYADSLRKARAGVDKGMQRDSGSLRRQADMADARQKELEAERDRETDPTRKKNLRLDAIAAGVEAADFRRQADANDAKIKTVQRERLTEEERDLEAFYSSGGRASADEVAKTAAAAEAIANLGEVARETERRMAEANERLATLRAERPSDEPGGRTAEQIRGDIEGTERQMELYREEQETARIRRDNAIKERDAATKKRKEAYQKQGENMLKPEYAMEQWAQTLERTIPTIVGAALDRDKLRAGIAGVYANAHKDPKQAAFEHLLHEVEHAAAHGAHAEAEEHAPDTAHAEPAGAPHDAGHAGH